MITSGFQDAVKIPELRKRVLFTVFMLIIYRIGVFVPTPGIDGERLRRIFDQASNTLFGVVNMFSGGALENFSVFALGIMPYISVSIIMQLMSHTVKSLEELRKEGEHGRRLITKWTRQGTIVLALIQGTLISMGLEAQGVVAEPGWEFRFKAALTLTAGTAFIMWIGEQITERGLGNGISLIIMSGIVARMPSTLVQTFDLVQTGEISALQLLLILLFAVATIGFIVWIERSQRRIPVQYPRRSVAGGKQMTQASTQHLPLKLNSAGVMPPIFASALILFPATIAQAAKTDWLNDVVALLHPGTLPYEIVFASLIIFFCFFYTALVINPAEMAENLKKQGGFIPTVRPGKETASFIEATLTRLTVWAAVYMCIICIIPTVFYLEMGAASFTYFFGGTAVLIVVGVTLDTVSQIQSHMLARHYEGFVAKGSGKVRGMGRAAQVRGRLIQR